MKYIVYNSSDTFEALTALKARIDASKAQLNTLLTSYNTTRYAADRYCLAGGIIGIGLSSKPDGWRFARGFIDARDFVYPKAIPANRKILEQLEAIPRVTRDELNAIVGFEPQWVGFTRHSGVGVHWGHSYYLIEVSDEVEYSPRQGMEELLVSEWKRLVAQLADEKEA